MQEKSRRSEPWAMLENKAAKIVFTCATYMVMGTVSCASVKHALLRVHNRLDNAVLLQS